MIDWKPWYRAEAESAFGRSVIADAVSRLPDGDPEVRRVLRAGGAASFPHTTLSDSAQPLARVATSLVAEGIERVVALGVLRASSGGDVAREFSLDLFERVLAAAATVRGVAPPDLVREFVGAPPPGSSRDDHVRAVAARVRPHLDARAALVATGDLVHAGSGYSTPEETAALPTDPEPLRAHFEARARALLDAATSDRPDEADAIAREIRSDQRHVLPVLLALLRGASTGVRARVLSFTLADYGPILGQPAPCVVASALVTFERGEP